LATGKVCQPAPSLPSSRPSRDPPCADPAAS
jgi:hypothetical protein